MREAWAARRDASWYDRPNTTGAKVVHVARSDGWSGCGRGFLDDSSRMALADVPVTSRCRRSGCRQRWPQP